jgi:acyl transferase domain-containing protein/SAM-dependent methyltransferase/acyl carrier protein
MTVMVASQNGNCLFTANMEHNLNVSKLVVFGPQILSWNQNSVSHLKASLDLTKSFDWVHEVLNDLSNLWPSLEDVLPHLHRLDGQKLLHQLKSWAQTGKLPAETFPLPNTILTPLVVLTHLAQYGKILDEHNGQAEQCRIRTSFQHDTQTLGLCTGLLSAAAVSFSSSTRDLEALGPVAIRLAIVIGAVVDAEDLGVNGTDRSKSFSVAYNAATKDTLECILCGFSEAYVAVQQDKWRCTVTVPQSSLTELQSKLRDAGCSITDMPLRGAFHNPKLECTLSKLSEFCNSNPAFRFPALSHTILPFRSNISGDIVTSEELHTHILQSILTTRSNWNKAFENAENDFLSKFSAEVVSFDAESCLPPTWSAKLRKRESRLIPTNGNFEGSLAKHMDDGVAVIGMSCHLPGAEDLMEYWSILKNGISQHEIVPSHRFHFETPWRAQDATKTIYGNFIKDYNAFDHKFFKKSPREIASTDPQHRLMLQVAYQAVEQSGYFNSPEETRDRRIGCYIGVGLSDYERNIACSPATAYAATGNLKSFTAGKISHHFGWSGPGLTIDTACSSSAVAIHNACRAILSGECTGGALAGGVNVMTNPEWFENLSGASFLSPTGQCKPFDAKGDGYCRGEGVGAVFLKKLSNALADGDHVLGVIASSLVYQNENCTPITVPNSPSLSNLFMDVIAKSHLEPRDITYVEAHGTGTPVGDPAEYGGIREVFGGIERDSPLSLGSVKGLVGHTEFASGITALLKVLLMMNMGGIPPQASFNTLSPLLRAAPQDGIEISEAFKPWRHEPRAALINNYGASGSNACLVVTAGPKSQTLHKADNVISKGIKYPFWFCANDEKSLKAYTQKCITLLSSNQALSVSEMSYLVSRQVNRTLTQSLQFACSSQNELHDKLGSFIKGDVRPIRKSSEGKRPVVLCFGGQTAKYVGLDRNLYNEIDILRHHLDVCDTACRNLGLESLYPGIFEKTTISNVVRLQTMLFAAQYSFAKAWLDCGLQITAMVGFSFGELVALAISQNWDVEKAISLLSARARAIQDYWGSEPGAMMAVDGDQASIDELLHSTADIFQPASIACYTGQMSVTLSASTEVIDMLYHTATHDERFSPIKTRKIDVTHAFHSRLVDRVLPAVEGLASDIQFRQPSIHLEHATRKHQDTTDLKSSYFAEHLRQPVYFKHAIERLEQRYGNCIWLEAGFNSGITSIVNRVIGQNCGSHIFQPMGIAAENGVQAVSDATLNLWKEGLNFTFLAHHKSQQHQYRFFPLPPYQFEKSRHWMDITLPGPKALNLQSDDGTPADLWSRIDDAQDNRTVRFKVNTENTVFQELVQGHFIAQTAPLCPSTLQISLAIDALRSLPSNSGLSPTIRNTILKAPMPVDLSKHTVIEAEATDSKLQEWSWRMVSYTNLDVQAGPTCHISGIIHFSFSTDGCFRDEFSRWSRVVGIERCHNLLYDRDPDEIVKGTNIYRRFAHIAEYSDTYRGIVKMVSKENETAGRVVPTFTSNAWLNVGLGDSFCQFAGYFVNTIAPVASGDLYVSSRIDNWMRSPDFDAARTAVAEYEVLAMHHKQEGQRYISDIFVFDPRTRNLVEIITGLHYQKVSRAGFVKTLLRYQPNTKAREGGQEQPAKSLPDLSVTDHGYPTPSQTPPTNSKAASVSGEASATCEVPGLVRSIVADLSGIEPDDIKHSSNLAELGIDSLMGMELAREIELAFGLKLDTEKLILLTDFNSLVSCVEEGLGLSTIIGLSTIKSKPETVVQSGQGFLAETEPAVQSRATTTSQTIPASTILDTFANCKSLTDKFIADFKMANYIKDILPKATELCVAHVLDAFEALGGDVRHATEGQRLARVKHIAKHTQFVDWIYSLLEDEAGLVRKVGDSFVRTAIPPPQQSAKELWQALLKDYPDHTHDHNLTYHVGTKLADCLAGKVDGIQLIFGSTQGREIVSNMYGSSPINVVWVRQMEHLLQDLMSRLNLDVSSEPIQFLEMGAGTGGTTARMLPLLVRAGVPVRYTITDISPSLVASARKRFKQYDFVDYKVLDIEKDTGAELLGSQHIVLATNCVHATHNLQDSLRNIRKVLRPDGFLMMLEMTRMISWVELTFGPVEGWWLFDDGRKHALVGPSEWERNLRAAGYGHVDWTGGEQPESEIQRVIFALASGFE